MKGLTKIIIDIGPLAIFFIFYTRGEEGTKLQSAILPLMIATIVAILISYILEKVFDRSSAASQPPLPQRGANASAAVA